MIQVDYPHFGFLKAKQIFFGNYLPPCDGYDFIYCKNYYSDLSYRQPFTRIECHTSLIDLTQDSDKLFGKVQAARRNTIRRGLKKDYHIKHHGPHADILKEFQRLYRKFTISKGAPAFLTGHSLTSLMPYMTIFTGELDDIIYNIMLFIHDGWTVRYHKSTRNEHHPRYKDCNILNSLVLWEAITHFKRLGYPIFDLGGVWLDPAEPMYGASQFKMSYGGETVPTYWYQAKISPLARTLGQGKTLFSRLFKKLR